MRMNHVFKDKELRDFIDVTFKVQDLNLQEAIPRCSKNESGYPEDYLTFVGTKKRTSLDKAPPDGLQIEHLNVTEAKKLIRQMCKLYASPKNIINLFLGDGTMEEAELFNQEAYNNGTMLLLALFNLKEALAESNIKALNKTAKPLQISKPEIEASIKEIEAKTKKHKEKIEYRNKLIVCSDSGLSEEWRKYFRGVKSAELKEAINRKESISSKAFSLSMREALTSSRINGIEKEKPTMTEAMEGDSVVHERNGIRL